MALGKCRECGRQVSSEASACPRCGVSSPVAPAREKTQAEQSGEKAGALGCLVVAALVFGWCYLTPSDEERVSKERSRLAAAEAKADSAAAVAFYRELVALSPQSLGKISTEACVAALPAILAAPESKTKTAWSESCRRTLDAVPPLSRSQVIAARQKFTVEVVSFDASTQHGNSFPYANRVRLRVHNGSEVRLGVLTVRTNRWAADGKLVGWSRAPTLQVGGIKPGEVAESDYFPLGHLPGVAKITVTVERSIRASDEQFFAELKQATPSKSSIGSGHTTANRPSNAPRPTRISLGTLADSLLAMLGKAESSRQAGTDAEGLLVEWRYPHVTYLLGRRGANGVTAYRVIKITPRL